MKPSADWSRSVAVGESVNGSTGLSVENGGQRVHIIWPYDTDEGIRLHYVQLGQSAQPIVESDLDLAGQLKAPRLVSSGRGYLHLFWSSREAGTQDWQLYYQRLEEDGRLSGTPKRLSPPGAVIGEYTAISDQAGGAVLTWGKGSAGDLYILHLGPDGSILSGPEIFASQGESPTARLDTAGQLHLAWRQGADIYYAVTGLDQLGAISGSRVTRLTLSTGVSLSGPVVGVTNDWVYILWSLLSQSGMEAGTASTEYVASPRGSMDFSNPERIWIPAEEEITYSPYQSSLGLTQLADLAQVPSQTSDFILNPNTLESQEAEMVVALGVNQQLRLDVQLQIATLVLRDGKVQGFSMAGKTDRISDDAVIAADSQGNLHLVWREGAGGNKVFYATTEPQARAELDRINAGDMIGAALQGGMESFVSVALLPVIGFGWLLPGLLVVGIYKLFRDYENMHDLVSWIPLIIAILMYEGLKWVTLPTMTSYVPFSAWLEIPSAWDAPLRLGMPILIFLVAAFVAYRMQKRYSASTLVFYMALGLTDAILSLAIYGVNFLGVF
ncbi:MAG: hypothetical protein P8074_07265 [Anaerolineales bacterium]